MLRTELLLVCVATFATTACHRVPYSSPTALRDTNAYVKAVASAAPGALDPQALSEFTITNEGDKLVATAPSRSGAEDSSDGFVHTVKWLMPGQKLQGKGASFQFVAFAATSPGLFTVPTNSQQRDPLDYFGQDGTRIPAEKLKAMGFKSRELTVSCSGGSGDLEDAFPKLRVRLGPIQQPPGYYSVVGLFDARTKKSLVSGYSYSEVGSNHLGEVTLHPQAWHPTPMELVLDVELDGRSVTESAVRPGMQIAVPGGRVQCLGVWDGGVHSWSSTSGSGGSTAILRIDLHQREDETNAVAVFATEPPKLAVHVELVGANGKVLPGNGGGTCDPLRMAGVRARAADVKLVRFTVFTNHYRVVVPLPAIPNLPVENRQVENLFQVTIPEARLQREAGLRNLIGGATQCSFAYPPGGDVMPLHLFPLALTNTTPAQLLAMYSGYLTNGYGVVVDKQKHEIRFQLTLVEKVRRWLKQKLGR